MRFLDRLRHRRDRRALVRFLAACRPLDDLLASEGVPASSIHWLVTTAQALLADGWNRADLHALGRAGMMGAPPWPTGRAADQGPVPDWVPAADTLFTRVTSAGLALRAR